MTREKAIERVKAVPGWSVFASDAAKLHVDSLVALGLLILDPPKTDEEVAADLLTAHFVHGKDATDLLRRNGFKIVRA